jgi:hypothetical protein
VKLWKKVLLKVPKVGAAYRAFRLHKKAKLAYKLRKLLKIIEEGKFNMHIFKSKTIWFGITQELWALWELFANGGAIDGDVILPVLTGIVTIILRAVTKEPLSQK